MRGQSALGPLAGLALRAQPDARLVGLFRQGHQEAYEEIVRRYRSALVGFAAGIVPRHRAEDVVQESLVRAHAALRGENEVEVRPWLYTIVRNRALNSVRDERIHEHLSEDLDGVPQPPDVAARRAEISGLVANIKALPDAQRQALVGRELEGRSHDEIAARLGATPGAVRGLIFRAREGLRTVSGVLVPPSIADWALGASAGGAGVATGGGLLLKAGAAASIGALAVGGGVALHHHSSDQAQARSPVAAHAHRAAHRSARRAIPPAAALAEVLPSTSTPASGAGSPADGAPMRDGGGSHDGSGPSASSPTAPTGGGGSPGGPPAGGDATDSSGSGRSSSGGGDSSGSRSGSDEGTSGSSAGTSGRGPGSSDGRGSSGGSGTESGGSDTGTGSGSGTGSGLPFGSGSPLGSGSGSPLGSGSPDSSGSADSSGSPDSSGPGSGGGSDDLPDPTGD